MGVTQLRHTRQTHVLSLTFSTARSSSLPPHHHHHHHHPTPTVSLMEEKVVETVGTGASICGGGVETGISAGICGGGIEARWEPVSLVEELGLFGREPVSVVEELKLDGW